MKLNLKPLFNGMSEILAEKMIIAAKPSVRQRLVFDVMGSGAACTLTLFFAQENET